jgi:hypothetical protein
VAFRELAERSGDGIVVTLRWDGSAAPGDDVLVDYYDPHQGAFCAFTPPRARALDAFLHPDEDTARAAQRRPRKT